MLRLLLLRHAKAAWPPGVHDAERPLAKRGREAAVRMAHYLKDEELVPDLVLVSPARRTLETWELVRPVLGDVEARRDGRIYEAPVSRLLAVLREVGPEVRTLLMIGHNPGFEDLAALLIDDGEQDDILLMRQKYPTAGLAVIDFPVDGWHEVGRKLGRLERFTTPKSLGTGGDD
ncbi:MAG TPA: histidine phosphatase family protein [Microvirga sp.]|nr:histidine phosphatase family protein [Microvirga sp.]